MTDASMVGNPAAAGPALLKVVDADEPPLRVFFGALPTVVVPGLYEARLATWHEWTDLAMAAHG